MYGKVEASLTNIYTYVNDYDLFKYYIPSFKEVGKLFKSELRVDNFPTCCIKKYEGTKLLYADFGTCITGMPAVTYVMEKFHLNYYEALDKIVIDFNLPLLLNCPYKKQEASVTKPIIYNQSIDTLPEASTSVLKVKVRDFNEEDRDYWYVKYSITREDLKKFNVYPISLCIHNDLIISYKLPTYGYFFGISDSIELWKIYSPLAQKGAEKWRTNCGSHIIQGYNQLPEKGDLLIITKSLKDVIILSKIGYNAVSPQAEGHRIPDDILQELKARFKQLYLFNDNDIPGIKASKIRSKEYGIPYFNLDTNLLPVKDSSDFVEDYGYDELSKLLPTLIRNASYYSEMGE